MSALGAGVPGGWKVDSSMGLAASDASFVLGAAREKHHSWRQSHDRLLGEVWPVMTPSFRIRSGAKIFTIGSCFARNIEDNLQLLGFEIPTLDFIVPRKEGRTRPNALLNKFTPAAIFQEIAWARNIVLNGGQITEADSAAFLYPCSDGLCIDTNLVGFVPVARERFFQRRAQLYGIFKEIFAADCVVITLGLIETWFDRDNGVYIQQAPVGRHFASQRDRFIFERLTYDRSRKFIQDSIDAVRELNPKVKFIVTTSPVPLQRTFTDDDVIVANSHSKSVLRAVAGEIAASNNDVDYFPSYESVATTKSWRIWKEDLVHVSDAFVGKIVARLIETYCSDVDEGRGLLQRSSVALKSEDLDTALEFARRAVEISAENADLRRYFGELLAQKGDFAAAAAQFERAIDREPRNPELYRLLSEVLERQGRLREAIAAGRRSIALKPADEELHRRLGRMLARRWKLSKAAVHFALAAGHRRLKRARRHGLKRLLRFSLPWLQRMTELSALALFCAA